MRLSSCEYITLQVINRSRKWKWRGWTPTCTRSTSERDRVNCFTQRDVWREWDRHQVEVNQFTLQMFEEIPSRRSFIPHTTMGQTHRHPENIMPQKIQRNMSVLCFCREYSGVTRQQLSTYIVQQKTRVIISISINSISIVNYIYYRLHSTTYNFPFIHTFLNTAVLPCKAPVWLSDVRDSLARACFWKSCVSKSPILQLESCLLSLMNHS